MYQRLKIVTKDRVPRSCGGEKLFITLLSTVVWSPLFFLFFLFFFFWRRRCCVVRASVLFHLFCFFLLSFCCMQSLCSLFSLFVSSLPHSLQPLGRVQSVSTPCRPAVLQSQSVLRRGASALPATMRCRHFFRAVPVPCAGTTDT